VILQDPTATAHLSALRALLAVARPGAQYPDGRSLSERLRFLPIPLEIDPRSGLPALKALSQVDADRALAPEFLEKHAAALPDRAPRYRALAEASLESLHRVQVRLIHRDRDASRVQIVRDLLDPASGCLVRFTVVALQRGEGQVAFVRGDLSRPTPQLTHAVEEAASGDAEMALLALAKLPGLIPEDVIRGQLGPFCTAQVPGPSLLAPVLACAPEGAVLHLALERAGSTVPEDRCLDPLASLYRDALQDEARARVEARRAELGYRVVKERRLVCSPELEAPLKIALSAAGARLVVRSR
jgi:hypothetical protein